MMRRPSPPRIGRSSPQRRPPPPRIRARRSPSGEDVKIVNWGAPGSGETLRQSRSDRPEERRRSRSRSRDKRSRGSGAHERANDRERDNRDNRNLPRNMRDHHDSRDLRELDRATSRNEPSRHLDAVKEKLHQVSKPLSYELQSYQQSFGQGPNFASSNNGRFDKVPSHMIIKPKEEPFLNPSASFHHNYQEPKLQHGSHSSSHLNYNPPDPIPTPGLIQRMALDKKSPRPEEHEAERIARLEKLVEKLVETQSNTVVQRNSVSAFVPPPLADTVRPLNELEIYNNKELIPSNTKFTTSMWLNSLQEECLERGFDEKTCIQYVKSKMTGMIKAWFKTVENYDFTWPELKLLVTKTFPDNVDFASSLRMLVQREKVAEETITQYFFSKLYLCEACKITGENAVSCLIDGLTNPFMKQDIRACNFLTPEVLFSEYFAKVPEHDNRNRVEREVAIYEDYPPHIGMLIERERMDYELELPSRDLHRMELGGTASRVARSDGRPSTKKEKCDTCNKIGHSAFDCRHAPLCYNCKGRGHIRAKCPNFVGLLNMSSGIVPYLATCEINGQKFWAQIDTGCTIVTITQSAVNRLGLRILDSKMHLYGYGGAATKVTGVVQAKIKVDQVEDMMLLFVVSDELQSFPLIVGQDFLNRPHVAVSIYQGQVRIFNYDVQYGQGIQVVNDKQSHNIDEQSVLNFGLHQKDQSGKQYQEHFL